MISLTQLIEKMSINPARILGLECGLRPHRNADITIIDPDLEYVIDASQFQSLSRNSPFDGWQLRGKPVFTIIDGRIVFDNEM